MKLMDKENSSMPDTVEHEQSQGPVDPFHDVEGCKPFYQHSFGYVLFPEIKIKIGLSHKSVGDVFIRNRAGEFEFGGTCTMKEVKLGVFSKLSGQASYGMIIFFATKRDYKNFVAGHNGPKKKHGKTFLLNSSFRNLSVDSNTNESKSTSFKSDCINEVSEDLSHSEEKPDSSRSFSSAGSGVQVRRVSGRHHPKGIKVFTTKEEHAKSFLSVFPESGLQYFTFDEAKSHTRKAAGPRMNRAASYNNHNDQDTW